MLDKLDRFSKLCRGYEEITRACAGTFEQSVRRQGIDSMKSIPPGYVASMAVFYDNHIPTQFLAPLGIDNPIPT